MKAKSIEIIPGSFYLGFTWSWNVKGEQFTEHQAAPILDTGTANTALEAFKAGYARYIKLGGVD